MNVHLVKDEIIEVNGRQLAYKVSGDPDGESVFLAHGTPGSCVGPNPRSIVLYRMGIKLITYDRPGYGDSDRNEGRHVVDCVEDIQAITRALKISRFAILGRSGGGPHALACAARMPNEVTKAISLVGLAPKDLEIGDWLYDMAPSNQATFMSSDAQIIAKSIMRAKRIRENPESVLGDIDEELRSTDRRVVEDVAIRRLLTESYWHAAKNGPWGLADDLMAFSKPWGFDLSEITVPTIFWHGANDNFSPPSHSITMSNRVAGSKVVIAPDSSHFTSFEVTPAMLAEAIKD